MRRNKSSNDDASADMTQLLNSTASPAGRPRASRSATRRASSGTAASSQPSTSKNVSHVPCKFYRQGVCQAGDSCPFSHVVDTDTQSVCKYFQKGNCKFGTKCALAHLTPDGRRIPKRDRHPEKDSSAASSATSGNAAAPASDVLSSHNLPTLPGHDKAILMLKKPNAAQGSYLSAATSGMAQVPFTKSGVGSGTPESPHTPLGGPLSTNGASIAPQSPTSRLMGLSLPSSTRSFSFNVSPVSRPGSRQGSFHSSFVESQVFAPRAASASRAPSSSSSVWAERSKHPLAFEGSAIADDDEDEEGFEEGLVPSALSDLLTPQERQRRSSRNSSHTRPEVLPPTATSTDLWRSYRRPSSSSANGQSSKRILEPIGTPKRADSIEQSAERAELEFQSDDDTEDSDTPKSLLGLGVSPSPHHDAAIVAK